MSTLHALLLFAGVPLALFVAISLLVMVPSIAKGPRYRPGLAWWAAPEWFGGPAELPSGGQEPRPALESAAGAPDSPPPVGAGGGASARW
jgi:hypothetical protein